LPILALVIDSLIKRFNYYQSQTVIFFGAALNKKTLIFLLSFKISKSKQLKLAQININMTAMQIQ
jgi:hypothetical protein